jgi:hypothetical protein
LSGVAEDERENGEVRRILDWRRAFLERAGYEREYADILATAVEVDLRDAVRLLDAGCRQSVAVLILL